VVQILLSERIAPDTESVRQEGVMSKANLMPVFLLAAGVFFILGFAAEIGQILAASG
jgi:hypothetical protein